MAEEKNPVVEMIRRIRMDIFERLQRGKLNYERDTSTLRKHAQLAETMREPILCGQLHDMLGIVEENTGHFDSAAYHLNKAYHIFEMEQDTLRMGRVQNNLGELYRHSARYDAALAAYTKARDLLKEAGDLASLPLVESNLGLTRLTMGEYDRAEDHFLNVISMTAAEPWNHLSTLIEARRGLAEVCLANNNLAEAWRQVGEAFRMASGSERALMLAEVNLTRAHIAEADPNPPEPPSTYYGFARSGLQNHHAPTIMARVFLDEARYQQRRGNPEDASRLAREAYSLFRDLGLEEEAGLAHTLIAV